MTDDRKPILCIDFDGVIHRYSREWQHGEIYDHVVPGFFEWAEKARERFVLTIFSSRSSTAEGRLEMMRWLIGELNSWRGDAGTSELMLTDFIFVSEKPPAFVTIDDRALRFEGDWTAPELQPDLLRAFQPWTVAGGRAVIGHKDADKLESAERKIEWLEGRIKRQAETIRELQEKTEQLQRDLKVGAP